MSTSPRVNLDEKAPTPMMGDSHFRKVLEAIAAVELPSVLECGGGGSSLLLQRETESVSGGFVCIESDPEWYGKLRAEGVRVIPAITETAYAAEIYDHGPYDVVLIDSAAELDDLRELRPWILDTLAGGNLAPGAQVFLHDSEEWLHRCAAETVERFEAVHHEEEAFLAERGRRAKARLWQGRFLR